MRIFAADDEKLALEELMDAIGQARPDAELHGFGKAGDLLAYAREVSCDVAFLDIEMRDMSGMELAEQLRKLNPHINIVFVTGYTQYMGEAFSLHASGYVSKPVTAEDICEELQNLRHPAAGRLRVQTFGSFEVFADGKPVDFRKAKSKELFALLCDRRGASLTTAEIATVLWEDREYTQSLKNQVQNVVVQMLAALKSVGAEEVIVKKWNKLSVDAAALDCDYYRLLLGDAAALRAFSGEYMVNYSWAEVTTGYLCRLTEQ